MGLNGIKVRNLSIEIGSVIINYAGNSSAADPTQFIFEVTFISVNSDSATQSGV